MRTALLTCLALLAPIADAQTEPWTDAQRYRYWAEEDRAGEMEFERQLLEVIDAGSLATTHERLCEEPHIAGTPGDLRQIDRLAGLMRGWGLDVEVHWFWAYLASPVSAELEIISPERISLEVTEPPIAEDPDTSNEALTFAYNAYSGSGEAVGEVVYANFGRKQDFEKLAELGVDCSGKIILARYGGNYRGYKAQFAEAAGAAGLIIFSDPGDRGYAKGAVWPEGGWANEHCIERGSLKTLPYSGDPLTPGVEASEDAERLDPAEVALPRIPVQPIGYGAAAQIIERMTGEPVPGGWQGGLPATYRLTGGPGLRVRMKVEQQRSIVRTGNVIGKLVGEHAPDECVLIGSHHDAWGFGAADPNAGTICTLEAARAFGTLAQQGHRPARTLLFCCWGAEEHGIIGSTEWVEANAEWLGTGAVAYINLDMAAMGPNIGSSATPSLRRIISEVLRDVPDAADPTRSAHAAMLSRGEDDLVPGEPRFGDLGGGSDHIALNCHLGVACASFGAGGSQGTSYHSNYDTLAWYRTVVGDDYQPALMLTRAAALMLARLANAPVPPLDPGRHGVEVRRHIRALRDKAGSCEAIRRDMPHLGLWLDIIDGMAAEITEAWKLRDAMQEGLIQPWKTIDEEREAAAALAPDVEMLPNGTFQITYTHELPSAGLEPDADDRLRITPSEPLWFDRRWITRDGMPGRPWFKSLLAASDENSGYASWILPELERAVERDDPQAMSEALTHLAGVLNTMVSASRTPIFGKPPRNYDTPDDLRPEFPIRNFNDPR